MQNVCLSKKKVKTYSNRMPWGKKRHIEKIEKLEKKKKFNRKKLIKPNIEWKQK